MRDSTKESRNKDLENIVTEQKPVKKEPKWARIGSSVTTSHQNYKKPYH
jgi:hypothetical protein